MGFKKIEKEFSFANVVLESSKKNNRSIQKMHHLNKSINWNRVEDILMSHYTIGTSNESIAVDARLVKSASRPISNDKIKETKEKHNTPEGKLDKNGNPLKFHRDLDSDWVVQKDIIHYGLKEHAAVDVNHGFILATALTPASVNDTNYLPYCTAYSRHTKQPIEKVYADKGYAGKPNRDFLHLNNIDDGIMRKDSTTAKLTSY